MVLAMMLGLASCSSEEHITGGNEVAEIDETRFMTVALSAPRDGGRGFEDGTKDESAVKRLDFLFYDRDGNPTATPQSFTGDELNSEFKDSENNNVTRIWTSVVPVQLTQGKNLPSQVICIVNADAGRITQFSQKSLAELRDADDGQLYHDGCFTMTNSVYYGKNTLTGEQKSRLCATPINNGMLFKTEDEAKQAIEASGDAAMVNIYVERLAAKVGLTMDAGAPKAYTLQNGDTGTGTINLVFTPQYWFMNAIAKNTYVTKRYGVPAKEGTGITMDPGFTNVDANFQNTGMANTWNSETNHRSYWGCSPSYNENNFPMVSDQVNDLENDQRKVGDYAQNYYSFNQVEDMATTAGSITDQAIAAQNGGFTFTTTGEETTGYIYTRETTTAISRIRDVENGNPAATVASAVIVGQYKVEGAEAATFYVDRNNGQNGTYYATEGKAKEVLAARNGFVFSDNAGTTPLVASAFVLEHPKASVRGEMPNSNIAGRLVTLQLANVPDNAYYFNGQQFVKISGENIDAANAQLAAGIGYLDMFKNGRAFFSVPIRHLGWPTADPTTEAELLKDGMYQWKNMRVGDLGLVRNHVYTLNINSIAGLGTGLRSDDQPIVPPVGETKQYVAARLNILAWNVVPGWSVNL